MRGPLAAILLALSLIASTSGQSEELPQTPRVKAEQKSKDALSTREEANHSPLGVQAPSPAPAITSRSMAANETAEHTKKSSEEGTEFWPPLFGYRLKVTDTLLVLFTAFVFGATWLLWCATNNLVADAKDTARKELRAYVAVEEIFFDHYTMALPERLKMFSREGTIHYTNNLKIKIKNYGNTPSFNTSISCSSNTSHPTNFTAGGPGVGKQMLHPGMSYSIEVTENASPRYNEKGWIWGHLIYQDIYNRWWRTNFFYAHHGESKFTPEKERNNEDGPYDEEPVA